MKKPLTFFALLCLTAVRLAWAEPARVALVIGNAAYSRAALANPVNDARAMTAALEAAGFRVTTLENASQKAMKQAVQAFAASLDGDTVALFYYSGHGVQHNGANYLIPVDTLENVQNEAQLEYEALDSGYILNAMENSGSRLNLFILDACRNSPFASATRGGQHGLAYMNGSRGTLIAYATAPGTVAYDGQGAANSPYTASLVKWMRQPLPIEQVLKNVLNEVRAATDGKQNPWYAASISSDFYFIAPSGVNTEFLAGRASAFRAVQPVFACLIKMTSSETTPPFSPTIARPHAPEASHVTARHPQHCPARHGQTNCHTRPTARTGRLSAAAARG